MFGTKRLKNEIERLRAELSEQRKKNDSLKNENAYLEKENAQLKKVILEKNNEIKELRPPEIVPVDNADGNTFGKWDPSIHFSGEQYSRQESAKHIPNDCIELNKVYQTAIIQSIAGTYHVTLDKCECQDFQSRQLPCKHIYRLAMELGKMPHESISDMIFVNKIMGVISDLTVEEQRSFGSVCYACGNNNINGSSTIDFSLAEKLIKRELVIFDKDLTPTFNVVSKDEMLYLFRNRTDFSINSKMTKKAINETIAPYVTLYDFPKAKRRPYVLLTDSIAPFAGMIYHKIRQTYPNIYE